jgi:hypothetical protein
MTFCINITPLEVTVTVRLRKHCHNIATLLAFKLASRNFISWHISGKEMNTLNVFLYMETTVLPVGLKALRAIRRNAVTKCDIWYKERPIRNLWHQCFKIVQFTLFAISLFKCKISLPQASTSCIPDERNYVEDSLANVAPHLWSTITLPRYNFSKQ